MMLVVDVVKGVQTQTAECLLVGELTCPRMVVILNKTDLLPPNKRQGAIDKMTKRLHKTLENTRYTHTHTQKPKTTHFVYTHCRLIPTLSLLSSFKDCPVIAVAAKPGGPEAPDTEEPQGIPELIEVRTLARVPQKMPGLLFSLLCLKI